MKRTDLVVAGHICLDVLPRFETAQPIDPGKLIKIGPATFATGGAVANTGTALRRLGASVQLVGRVGDDPFGREVLAILARVSPALARRIRVIRGGATSYSIVISPPGIDRSFLHCSSENDHFTAADLANVSWERASLFHFGYPPMMRRMYTGGGAELARVFELARSRGVLTSLDMCMPDEQGESGKVNWRTVLKRTLPHVDLFCPSVEELVFMLDRDRFNLWKKLRGKFSKAITAPLLRDLSDQCLRLGAGAVLIKLGESGLYLRTSPETALTKVGKGWSGRELLCGCRKVNVVGTTGSGDCTIAGFLLALHRGQAPESALQWATAVGASCCEAADATSAIRTWAAIQERIDRGWPWLGSTLKLAGWVPHAEGLAGPSDASSR